MIVLWVKINKYTSNNEQKTIEEIKQNTDIIKKIRNALLIIIILFILYCLVI